jgi:spore protease
MSIRTDLAVEFMADKTQDSQSVAVHKYKVDDILVTNVEILSESAAKEIGKPMGKYVTLETNSKINIFELDELRELMIAEVRGLVGRIEGDILVVGIGNTTITPDSLGPKVAKNIFATRHISPELAKKLGLGEIKSVSVLSPGVLGQTGIEVKEIIEAAIEKIKPQTIVLIDALAAREVSRLGCTVQLSNTGIVPGSGVGNSRAELSQETLGVKCVTIGVPMVVDAATLCYDLTGVSKKQHETLIVTPRDIDRLVEKSSQIISYVLNYALQPDADVELLLSCV